MATAPAAPAKQRLVLYGVPWHTYTKLLRALDERPLRITYDRGALEIRTLTHEHESYGTFLGRLAVTLTEELGKPLKEGGSTTFRSKRKEKGLESDNCYWIASEALVRGKLRIDLRVDPAPDLAIEIDITHSSLNRMAIYAALRVPEVWRYSGQALTFHGLEPDGKYAVTPCSLSFPGLTPADLMPFLALRQQMDENAVIRQFREWIRQRFLQGGPPVDP